MEGLLDQDDLEAMINAMEDNGNSGDENHDDCDEPKNKDGVSYMQLLNEEMNFHDYSIITAISALNFEVNVVMPGLLDEPECTEQMKDELEIKQTMLYAHKILINKQIRTKKLNLDGYLKIVQENLEKHKTLLDQAKEASDGTKSRIEQRIKLIESEAINVGQKVESKKPRGYKKLWTIIEQGESCENDDDDADDNEEYREKSGKMDPIEDIPDHSIDQVDQIINELEKNFMTLQLMKNNFRKTQLSVLKNHLLQAEAEFIQACHRDTNLSAHCAYPRLFVFANLVIDNFLQNIDKWTAERHAPSMIANMMTKYYVKARGKGVWAAIGGCFGDPLSVLLGLVGAVATGNCCIVKPSGLNKNTSNFLKRICDKCLDPRFFRMIEGGVETDRKLMTHTKITGIHLVSVDNAQIDWALENKMPYTEIICKRNGGNAAIVDVSCNMETTIGQLVKGKFHNAGQQHYAADYCLVHANSMEEFKTKLIARIKKLYGADSRNSQYFGRLVSVGHAERTDALINEFSDKIVYQCGKSDVTNRFVPPTIIEQTEVVPKLMYEEQNAPVQVIKSFNRHDEIVDILKKRGRSAIHISYFGDTNSPLKDTLQKRVPSMALFTNENMLAMCNQQVSVEACGGGFGGMTSQSLFDSMSDLRVVCETPLDNVKELGDWDTIKSIQESMLDIKKKMKYAGFLMKPMSENLVCALKMMTLFMILVVLNQFNWVVISIPLLDKIYGSFF